MKIENIDVNSYPGSEKVYIDGKLHPIRVAMRRVNLTPTVKIIDGEKMTRKNDPVYVYDTGGSARSGWSVAKISNSYPTLHPTTDACARPTKVSTQSVSPTDMHPGVRLKAAI